MSLHAILNRLQDISELYDLAYGLGTVAVRNLERYYVILSWDISIKRQIDLNELIEVRTYLNRKRRRFSIRSFEILDEYGNIVLTASANIGICSTQTCKLADSPDEIFLKQTVDDFSAHPKMMLSNDLGKNEFVESRRFYVSKYLTDVNGHVNNANYVHFLLEDIEADEVITDLKIFYNSPAFAGEELISYICVTEFGKIIKITSVDGEVKITASITTK